MQSCSFFTPYLFVNKVCSSNNYVIINKFISILKFEQKQKLRVYLFYFSSSKTWVKKNYFRLEGSLPVAGCPKALSAGNSRSGPNEGRGMDGYHRYPA